jgi:mannosyltransferase
MRDNGIAYGFNPAIFQRTNLRDISPRIKSFVDKYPDLLHEDADMPCLLGNKSDPAMRPCDSDDDIDDLLEDEDKSGLKMRIA